MPRVSVVTTSLELTDRGAIVPARRPAVAARLERVAEPSPAYSRFWYTAVGGGWYWRDKLAWSWSEWAAFLGRPGFETWTLFVAGNPAGYFELDAADPGAVEIVSFGLLPAFIGRGLGGWLLERALHRALTVGCRVWLHTCTLDGPAALANYRARGLVPFASEAADVDLPPEPPGPWPGSGFAGGPR
ncbi:MAG: GNAT family N-acetyltransferase [Gemmatimonadales bacterium]